VLWRWLEKEELPNPMARMKPPIVPEQPIPIIPADGLRRLLTACVGDHVGSPVLLIESPHLSTW
jgi:hypothetical protein